MDFTFVPQYNGEPPKRRRLAKACESCRARKKRCHHNPIEGSDDESPAVPDEQRTAVDATGSYKGISVRKGRSNRFLSDLSPLTRLLERNVAESENRQAKSMTAVGMWVNKDEYEFLVRQRDAALEAGLIDGQADKVSSVTIAPLRPDAAQVAALVDIYFDRVHPIIPLLDEAEFRQAYAAGLVPEPYLHAVCLTAAKDNSAEEVLNSSSQGSTIFRRELCTSLHASVKAALINAKYDKITMLRILALLSTHIEGLEGAEEASLHLVQAMHHCQTLGLHISASLPDKQNKVTKRIFWCVWILDRLAAVMNGRPIFMADTDVAIESFEPGESGFPAFEILLKIVMIMNELIDFYRPGRDPTVTGWEAKFPGFEEIVDAVNGWSLPSSMLSTLHIAYAAGAILSHRSKGSADYASTTPSYVRQSLATIQIVRFMSLPRLRTLHPLPILPYAVSLALSVSYQHMRQDQLQAQQEDAKADFESCLATLKDLRRTWSSVDAMYVLSQKVIDELNRVPDMAAFRVRRATKMDRQLAAVSSACRHEGEKPVHMTQAKAATDLVNRDLATNLQQSYDTPPMGNDSSYKDHGLFEGIDDIFGTYLDPNYPVNLDFLTDFAPQQSWLPDYAVMNNT